MAELVDALASDASRSNPVEVQVLSSAPKRGGPSGPLFFGLKDIESPQSGGENCLWQFARPETDCELCLQ